MREPHINQQSRSITRYSLLNYALRYRARLIPHPPFPRTQPANMPRTDWLIDGGYLPQAVIRLGIRRQLAERIASIGTGTLAEGYEGKAEFVGRLRARPIAVETAAANRQHYEVGTGVLAACLGPRMKYSCCLYPSGRETLAEAEVEMLRSYVDKAGLEDGMEILDLG